MGAIVKDAPDSVRTRKVGMISLGCAKNLVDAEIMLGSVLERGMQITANADATNAAPTIRPYFIEIIVCSISSAFLVPFGISSIAVRRQGVNAMPTIAYVINAAADRKHIDPIPLDALKCVVTPPRRRVRTYKRRCPSLTKYDHLA